MIIYGKKKNELCNNHILLIEYGSDFETARKKVEYEIKLSKLSKDCEKAAKLTRREQIISAFRKGYFEDLNQKITKELDNKENWELYNSDYYDKLILVRWQLRKKLEAWKKEALDSMEELYKINELLGGEDKLKVYSEFFEILRRNIDENYNIINLDNLIQESEEFSNRQGGNESISDIEEISLQDIGGIMKHLSSSNGLIKSLIYLIINPLKVTKKLQESTLEEIKYIQKKLGLSTEQLGSFSNFEEQVKSYLNSEKIRDYRKELIEHVINLTVEKSQFQINQEKVGSEAYESILKKNNEEFYKFAEKIEAETLLEKGSFVGPINFTDYLKLLEEKITNSLRNTKDLLAITEKEKVESEKKLGETESKLENYKGKVSELEKKAEAGTDEKEKITDLQEEVRKLKENSESLESKHSERKKEWKKRENELKINQEMGKGVRKYLRVNIGEEKFEELVEQLPKTPEPPK